MAGGIQTQNVTYTAGGTTLQGYLAVPDSMGGTRPGVIVVHEWWGLNDYIRRRADMLAELGYIALAADMYGDGKVADTPEGASGLMNGVLKDPASASARLLAAFDLIKSTPKLDKRRIAAIGYCFGGAMVLHAARIGMPLSGVVSFHGALGSFHTPAPGSVRAKVLVCHGGADALVPDADVTAFKAEMDNARADYKFIEYPGALHGFTNPDATAKGKQYGLPLAYDEAVDQQSWEDMQLFFRGAFA